MILLACNAVHFIRNLKHSGHMQLSGKCLWKGCI